jgi:branched-chain amino acid transport system ATP-binding protein
VASLQVSGVSVAFGGHRVLSGVDVTAAPGRVTGLIGPNGAGKSTLFDVICGLRTPSAGRVVLGGRDVTGGPGTGWPGRSSGSNSSAG